MPVLTASPSAVTVNRLSSNSRAGVALPTAVVVGTEQNGLGVIRALGREGVPVIGIHDASRQLPGTRFATSVSCGDIRGKGLIQSLIEIASSLPQPPVLVPTMDRTVTLIAEHREIIDRHFVHSFPPAHVIDRLMNKATTDEYARTHGFLVPRTFAVQNENELRACAKEIDFPCILKPQVKNVDFVAHTPRKAFLIKSREELFSTYELVGQWEPEVVIQEWVPGGDERLLFCLYYFNRQGEPLASFSGRKIRQFIPYCGTACSAEPWQDEWVKEAGIRFFQAAGYSGYGAIEFKVDPSGRYFLIEPTVGRTEHLFALAAANGINLPFIGYCDVAGIEVPPVAPAPRRMYLDWRRDLRAARHYIAHGELTWPQWLRSVAGRKQYALFAWDDPLPYAQHAGGRVMRTAGRFTRRVQRRVADLLAPLQDLMNPEASSSRVQPQPAATQAHIEGALDWLARAQDSTGVHGVARGYSVSGRSRYRRGWQPAYPETTGYIIPTLYDCAERWNRPELAERGRRMADWEVSVQLPNGGFPGSTADRRVPAVVFNTGMILLGLSRTFIETNDRRYLDSAARAVDFLLRVQAPDGAWRQFTSVSGQPLVHAYDLLVGKGLLQAALILGDVERIETAVRRNIEFSLSLQRPNGWMASNGIRPRHHASPPTHTIGYVTQGLLDCGLALKEPRYIAAARQLADAVAPHVAEDGFLAGRFDANWNPLPTCSCLTGTAQMSIVWWTLFEHTGEPQYRDVALRAMRYVKCRQDLSSSNPGVRGGIAGSFPIDGYYGRYQYLNWAAKFFIDALLLEDRLEHAEPPHARRAGAETLTVERS